MDIQHRQHIVVALFIGIIVSIFTFILGVPVGKAVSACSESAVMTQIIKSQRPGMGDMEVEFLRGMAQRFSEAQGISPVVTVSMWAQESQFNYKLVSPKGAKGLSQVMPFWIKEHPDHCQNVDLFEAEANARCGVKILADYTKGEKGFEKCKGVFNGLRCYNGGPTSLANPATEQYAKEVLARASVAAVKTCKTLPGMYE